MTNRQFSHCELPACAAAMAGRWREYIPRPLPTKSYVAFGGPKQEQGDLPIANAGPLLDYSFLSRTVRDNPSRFFKL
jgi:hypothetical protein